MKERPILFTGPLVRAILDGRKTQTRRIVKGEGLKCCEHWKDNAAYRNSLCGCMCPYGAISDRLWVREKFASRITLEITGVRVERLQDISEADAEAEGVITDAGPVPCYTYTEAFEDFWNSINGPGSWESNPWVWVVEFKRVTE